MGGRLIFELGGISEREVTKLKEEADKLGKGSFAFAFYMDRQKEERERGVTISCTTKEFFTESYHYTVIDAPGHRDFIKNMITGRVEQGKCVKESAVKFLPTHSASTACTGKVFTVEMHHKNVEMAHQGDNVGMNIKGLPKDNMPRVGDIMVTADDATCARTATFTAQIQVLNHPGELKPGYTPIAFVRTGRSAVKMTEINWKVGKSTGGQKVEGAVFIKAGEMGLITFEPAQPFVVESFKKCEGLGRLAIMEGNSVVMLGKCTKTTDYVEK